MAFEKCKRCGFMHYATDPCKSSAAVRKDVQAVGEVPTVAAMPTSEGMGSIPCLAGTQAQPADPLAKFDKKAYMKLYMRDYRKRKSLTKANA